MQVPLDPDPRLNPFYVVRAFMRAGGLIRFMPPPRALLEESRSGDCCTKRTSIRPSCAFALHIRRRDRQILSCQTGFGKDRWENLGVKRPSGSETVTPPGRADELLAPFLPDAPSDPELFGRFLPGPDHESQMTRYSIPFQGIRITSVLDDRTFRVSESILTGNPDQPFLAVYIGGLDSVEHAFWQYRFPEDFSRDRPAQPDVERLGPVLDRYVTYIDRRLQRLLALYASTPNVLIVSDHGHGPAVTVASWRGAHQGRYFHSAGPSVTLRQEKIDVSYYDVLPTIAWLKGFRSRSATGRSLLP